MPVSTRHKIRRLFFPVRAELHSQLARYPGIYLPIARRREATRGQVVTDRTDIVIEGFPRSANSFAVDAFRLAQARPMDVAHHLHAPAQIIDGVRRGLPVILLLRDPFEAVLSLKAMRLEGAQRNGNLEGINSLRQFFRMYIRFYERVRPYCHSCVLGHFPQVTTDMESIIDRTNGFFGTTFGVFSHTDQEVASLRKRQGFHAAPTAARRRIRTQLQRELDELRGSGVATEARALYDELLDAMRPQRRAAPAAR